MNATPRGERIDKLHPAPHDHFNTPRPAAPRLSAMTRRLTHAQVSHHAKGALPYHLSPSTIVHLTNLRSIHHVQFSASDPH